MSPIRFLSLPKLLLGVLLLGAVGCSSHFDMQEICDEGDALEVKAYRQKRSENYSKAAGIFAEARTKYLEAHEIAVERNNGVFKGHLRLKLASIYAGEAICRRPDINTEADDWKAPSDLYREAVTWSSEGGFLRMERDMWVGIAECARPDKNEAGGDWKRAAEHYRKAVKFSREIKDDEGLGANLRAQAICLLEGPNIKSLTDETKKLLIEASRLGDTKAAELLSETGQRFCYGCSKEISGDVRFCPKCGRDQVQAPKKETPPPPREAPE